MTSELLNIGSVLLVGCGLKLLALLIADAKRLRLLLAISLVLDVSFLSFGGLLGVSAQSSLWIVLGFNLILAAAYLREHTTLGFSARDKRLYAAFETLSPGHLRKVIRIAKPHQVTVPTEVITEATTPEHLLFVEGFRFEIHKGDQMSEAKGPAFVGEIAFLTAEPASATVILPPGTPYLSWDVNRLHALMRSNPGLKNALVARFSLDLAAKVARSMPLEL